MNPSADLNYVSVVAVIVDISLYTMSSLDFVAGIRVLPLNTHTVALSRPRAVYMRLYMQNTH